MALITADELQTVYVTFFARPADLSGYEYWTQQEKDAALASISGSDEAKLMYAGKGEGAVINQIYQNLLGRDTDVDGNFYWAQQLVKDAEGNFTNIAEVALTIATAAANNPNKNEDGKYDKLAIEYKIMAANEFTAGLQANPTAATNYLNNQQAGKDLLKGINADSTPATVSEAVKKAVDNAAQGGTSGEGTEFTFSNTTTATLNDNTNIGFTPEKTFLVDGNDKIIIESFDALNASTVTIADPSVKDNDILTIGLTANNSSVFGSGDTIKNIETIHINTTGAVSSITKGATATIEGLKVLEIAGDVANSLTVGDFGAGKVDASGITSGNVVLNAVGTNATELVGGAGNDTLTIGKEGGILTGNAGGDTFVVGAAKDKLVTITDIASKDKVDFGTTIGNKAVALTITNASDETTFVDALQKAADKEAANGLYYAEFNGNTYVVANGQAGKEFTGSVDLSATFASGKKISVTSAAGSYTPAATAGVDLASANSISGDLTLAAGDNLKIVSAASITTSGKLSVKLGAVNSGGTLSGTIGVTAKDNAGNYTLSPTSGKLAATSAATVDKITFNGATYSVSDFSQLNIAQSAQVDSVKFSVVKTSAAGTLSANKTTFTGVTVKGASAGSIDITGVMATGVLGADENALKDDIIVKLAGSHTLNTEATIADSVLTFA